MLLALPWPSLARARQAYASVLASGLVLGLAVTTVSAAPALAAPSSGSASAPLTEPLDPTFVQEGTPSPHGGQVVMWGEREWAYNGATRMVPEALPDGVLATAVSSDSSDLLVLRSDGLVDGWDSAGMLNPTAPPAGTTYTAVAASSGRLLRSDGVIVDTGGNVALTRPAGVVYTALSGFDALRSDGLIAPLDDDASCADARRPGAGLRYTAISSVPDYAVWAAVRSDGALVYCTTSGGAVVRQPSAGTRFVGVDRSAGEILAATSDGQIVAVMGAQPPAVPQGRSVVSLAAISKGAGAAVLDDGSILRWGLTGKGAELPAVPTDRATYSAVENGAYNSHRWAIMVGDPIPVDVIANIAEPAGRPLRVTDDLRVDATIRSVDGTPAFGHVVAEAIGPDEFEDRWPRRETLTGTIGLTLDPRLSRGDGVGRWDVAVTFAGSPFATTTVTASTEMAAPSPVEIVAAGPTTWRQTAHEGTLCFDVVSEDGSPIWGHTFGLAVAEDPTKSIGGGFSPPECVNNLDLRAGSWTVEFGYTGWGQVDSAEWTGPVVVREPAVSALRVNLPATWRYDQMPGTIPFAVDAEELSAEGIVRLVINGEYWTGSSLKDGAGTIDTWSERVPGTYLYRFEYEGGFGALPSAWEQMVTVQPGLFTTVAPKVTGTAKAGATLTAARGIWVPEPTGVQYLWKADGTVIANATSSALKVPASAVGKEITVTVIGDRRYYSTGSATSAPTAAVAPATFSAPQPKIKGTVKVGRTLTAYRGTWSPSPSSVKYVWKANGRTISTRTSSTFVVPASAKDKRLTVTVTGARAGYTAKSVTSTTTTTVAAGTFSAPRPAVRGTKRVGSTLTVVRGTWSPTPSTVKYVWKANGVTISTRTSSRFVVPARARGKQLTVTVVGSRTGYSTKSATSYRTTTIR
ncbi:hypothetical protein [Promicromonospora iranensis]|uniref:hypothetical protein n=1 Tax=Promicromonospora iranensis TaxID=1105144 RepID=UPI0023A9AC6B|nr:hypothetical protein [Promicromonospora iranensis]